MKPKLWAMCRDVIIERLKSSVNSILFGAGSERRRVRNKNVHGGHALHEARNFPFGEMPSLILVFRASSKSAKSDAPHINYGAVKIPETGNLLGVMISRNAKCRDRPRHKPNVVERIDIDIAQGHNKIEVIFRQFRHPK